MKNTMKIKSLLSFFVPAALMTLIVASCSDYDNGYTQSAIKFAEDFRSAFGEIDPEQDWNLAERQFVTVTTQSESEVKIYAKAGEEYTIVGDYEGVKGTQELGYDVVEGTKEILVSDGKEGIMTTSGGHVVFGMGTRNVQDKTENGVTVTLLKNEVKIGEETFPAYRTSRKEEVDEMFSRVPQGENNINRVTSNFSYVSTGSFIIYPFYWYTESENTLGVYYFKEGETKPTMIDIYESKGTAWGENNTGELWYLMDVEDDFVKDDDGGGNADRDAGGWYLNSNPRNTWCAFQVQTSTSESDNSGITAPFMEVWRATTDDQGNPVNLGTLGMRKEFTVSPNEECIVEVVARLRNQKNSSTENMGSVVFEANGQSVQLNADGNCTKEVSNNGQGTLYSNMNGTGKIYVRCKADSNGKILVRFNIDCPNSNWFSFKDLTIKRVDENIDVANMTATGSKEFPGEQLEGKRYGDTSDDKIAQFFKGQGIKVDIPAGTQFGMYIRKTDATGTYTIYSQADLNKSNTGLVGNYNGGSQNEGYDYPPYYASTFEVGDQKFIGFEDWPGAHYGDYDLNDLVLAFDGAKPITINEDPTTSTWLLACEDLGGSFDIDYNDVVFSIEHISGQTTAKLTPLAAGGTLASFIYFQDPFGHNDKCFGEIHQLFGAEPQNSGSYAIINAYSRYNKSADPITFDVDKDWTMAYYSIGESGGTAYQNCNMGGFEIRTLRHGQSSAGTFTVNDSRFSGQSIQPGELQSSTNVPFILCIPYPYTRYNYPEVGKKSTFVWAWPIEFQHIAYDNGTGPYPDFVGWVRDHTQNTDWYKNRTTDSNFARSTVEELMFSSGDMTQAEINANLNNDQTELQIKQALVTVPHDNPRYDFEDNIVPATNGGPVTYVIYSLDKKYQMGPNDGTHGGNFTNGAGIVAVTQNGVTKEFTVKYESPLGNKGTMTVQKPENDGVSVDLYSNLTGTIDGATYTYDYGSTTDHSSPTVKLWNTGSRTVTVHQAETDNYVAGTTTFQLILAQSGHLEAQRQSGYVFKVYANNDGTYNVYYPENNGSLIKSNVTSFTLTWSDCYVNYNDGQGDRELGLYVTNNNNKSESLTGRNNSYEIKLSDFKPSYDISGGFTIQVAGNSGCPFYLTVN